MTTCIACEISKLWIGASPRLDTPGWTSDFSHLDCQIHAGILIKNRPLLATEKLNAPLRP